MSRYDGLIIPRSYSEYINKTDAATLSQALQLPSVMDSTPTENSNSPVRSGGIYTALAGKQPTLTFDTIPTVGSNNPVSSDGLYTALGAMFIHNIPRLVPKDITAYITDGTLWKRLNGTNGFALFEDIYVGDYFEMSRAISAYEKTGTYQTTGSKFVTIAGIDTMWGNGDSDVISKHHLVMVPGQGFGGTQHFGSSRMNATSTAEGGYKASEMNVETLGAVTSSGSTAATASINQQLYAEFGAHLQTTRELVSNALNASGINRFGGGGYLGCSSSWGWISAQAVLMSEIEVFGATVWSSSGFDTGNANKQLPLFAFSKQAQNNRTAWYWLKDVSSAARFCLVGDHGGCTDGEASDANVNVRPRFILAA